jgi:hypothetical protein
MHFYTLTGDTRYMARIPEALNWLESVKLPANLIKNGRQYPTFIEIGTNKSLWLHRTGSNVTNGHYWADYNPTHLIEHYSSTRQIDVPALRAEYQRLMAEPVAEVTRDSPIKPGPAHALPRFYLTPDLAENSDRNLEGMEKEGVAQLVSSLNAQGYWPTELKVTSHPYSGPSPAKVAAGVFGPTRVGDESDTSPYIDPHPVIGISTGAYIENMEKLIAALQSPRQ